MLWNRRQYITAPKTVKPTAASVAPAWRYATIRLKVSLLSHLGLSSVATNGAALDMVACRCTSLFASVEYDVRHFGFTKGTA